MQIMDTVSSEIKCSLCGLPIPKNLPVYQIAKQKFDPDDYATKTVAQRVCPFCWVRIHGKTV